MTEPLHSLLLIAVIASVTAAIRFMPFAVFRKEAPSIVIYLGKVLPYAIMGMLLVYCFKNVSLFTGAHGIPEFIAVAFAILMHKWKHSTIISLVGSTAIYMTLVQLVF
ncbi:MAG: branched-chain amino acid transporter AzlD [Firmicutes bacterium]|nr:branched-chain amino acid transporter AzlD [Bacillota bacterium]